MTAVVVEVLDGSDVTLADSSVVPTVEVLTDPTTAVVEVIEQGPQGPRGVPGIEATELEVDPALLFENALI